MDSCGLSQLPQALGTAVGLSNAPFAGAVSARSGHATSWNCCAWGDVCCRWGLNQPKLKNIMLVKLDHVPEVGMNIQKYLKPLPRVFLGGRKTANWLFFVEADLAFGGVTDLASGEGLFDLFFCFLFGFNCSHCFFPHLWNGWFFGWKSQIWWQPCILVAAIDFLCLQPKVPNVKALVVPMHLSLTEVDGWVESPARGRVFNEWKLPPLVRQSTV